MLNNERLTIYKEPIPGSSGKLVVQHLRPGLYLKYEDLTINLAQNLSLAFEPGIRIVFALHGTTHIRIGHQEICFSSDAQFSAAVFPVNKNSLGYKRFNTQKNKRELVLFLSPSWLQECLNQEEFDSIQHILNDHLRPFYFSITPLIHQQLQRMCGDEYLTLRPLQQETQCLNLIHDVLQLIIPKKRLCADERLAQIADKIDLLLQLDDSQKLSIKQIAHQCHSNATSIQRIFKQRHDITIGAYRRQQQLAKGHSALRQGASVIQASQLAGYNHLQSFSDAFRKEFGYLPKTIKNLAYQ